MFETVNLLLTEGRLVLIYDPVFDKAESAMVQCAESLGFKLERKEKLNEKRVIVIWVKNKV